jgi:putative transposase
MKYAWIQQHRDSFPVAAMCRTLRVSKSGFYRSRSAGPSARALRSTRIREAVKQVHEQSDGIYGSYKIARQLQTDDQLESACRNTVATAMNELGLKSKVSKRFKPTTTVVDPTRKPAGNLLDQVFETDQPNRKWVTDITYLPTQNGWVYLAAVLDLFSRKIVGWSIGNSLATTLVSEALRQAIELRGPDTKQLLHHRDRGCQYTSDAYQTTLKTLGITCSMSRTGCCYDNAVMERFFWSLKHEWTKHDTYADLEDARLSVFRYIETFYNPVRLHQTLNYLSPDQYEQKHNTQLAT